MTISNRAIPLYELVPDCYVSQVRWSAEVGRRLKRYRSNLPRRKLAEKLSSEGVNCSQQYIQKLEDFADQVQSVGIDIVLSICKALGIRPTDLLTTEQIQ
ncbi:MAG: helix-turn-helix transcriptional regulator [Plectolyngbya sp. WJT66-NPBG17]|nr:helix-turn-helix transcriptional regulator [Plectolyngbya sp. WJT66-NPBG17]